MSATAIIRELEKYREAAKVSAEFSDMVSAEALSAMTFKSIRQVKDILAANGIEAIGHFGKSPLYPKSKVLATIKRTA
jgi:hypothetical protein